MKVPEASVVRTAARTKSVLTKTPFESGAKLEKDLEARIKMEGMRALE